MSSSTSVSSAYELLSEPVKAWVADQGWSALRAIQERAIPIILAGETDVIIAAPTASGKSEAALLPVFSRLTEERISEGLGALCVSPLKALINDQLDRFDSLASRASIPLNSWHGDVPASKKKTVWERPDGALLITPESVEALFVRRGFEIRKLFGQLRYILVDELHAFIGSERGRQLQSLMHRLEKVAGRRIPRIAMSATLGDMALAQEFLRPQDPESVKIVKGDSEFSGKAQIRGYIAKNLDSIGSAGDVDATAAAQDEIAGHIFVNLRTRDNLIFTNSRGEVEDLADRLRRLSDEKRLPNEFFPHHGNLSRDLREQAEQRLKDSRLPSSAICTSTLELGIDLGSVDTVAQVGPPYGAASLRQRLGRSGRRPGSQAELRIYVTEPEFAADPPLGDKLRLRVLQSMAVFELMLEGWCESPVRGALHLSTLVQQVLSLICQYGGAQASQLYATLCDQGPFELDAKGFAVLLRGLAAEEVVQQLNSGEIVLGVRGERIVEDYKFYAAFTTPVEYRIVAEGKELGTMPIDTGLTLDSYLIFGGLRWQVVSIDEDRRVVSVVASPGGRPPVFAGHGGEVETEVRRRMRAILESDHEPSYLDRTAKQLLSEARAAYRELRLGDHEVLRLGGGSALVLWLGDRELTAIILALTDAGYRAYQHGPIIMVDKTGPLEVVGSLREIFGSQNLPDAIELAENVRNLRKEKHDWLVPDSLLVRDFAIRSIDVPGAAKAVADLRVDDTMPLDSPAGNATS